MKLRSIWRKGVFCGFSLVINGELTTPQPYKLAMIGARDKGSDPIYIEPKRVYEPWGGFGACDGYNK